jgi:gas vesicle protein GvpO
MHPRDGHDRDRRGATVADRASPVDREFDRKGDREFDREGEEPGYDREERRQRLRAPGRDDRTAGGSEPDEGEGPRRARRPRGPLTGETAARQAAAAVAEMTGKEPEEIISLEQTDEGLWQIDVEVVETRRIPDSTDILASYRVELDPDGELVSYRRTQRYSRCQVGER